MRKLFTCLLLVLSLAFYSINLQSQTYCTPSWSNSGTNWQIGTSSVTLTTSYGTFTNPTGCPTTVATYNYYPSFSLSVLAGGTVNFSVTVGNTNPVWFCIYVDLNNDGVFNTSGAEFAYSSTSIAASGTAVGSFVIPTTATIGTLRLRIISDFGGMGVPPTPCGPNYYAGEAEDYNLTVLPLAGLNVAMKSIDSQVVWKPGLNNIYVTYQNAKKDSIKWAYLGYSLDGVPVANYRDSISKKLGHALGTAQSRQFKYPTKVNITSGQHLLKVWVTKPNDSFPDNNRADDTIAETVCSGISGTFTIGPSGNFSSFSAAVAAMVNCGVSGPIVFNVSPGTYSEQVVIPSILGANSKSTITFNGSGVSSTILTWGGGYGTATTLQFNGAKYVTFQNMSINTTGTYYGVCVWFNNNASNDKISGCNLYAYRYNLYSDWYVVNIYGGTNDNYPYAYGADNGYNNIIENNLISGGGYYGGVSWIGSGSGYNINYNNTFRGNTFEYQYQYSLYFEYTGGNKILNNTIWKPDNTNHYGIFNDETAADTIDGNNIQAGEIGIYQDYFNNYYSPSSWYTLIVNNMISNFSNSTYQDGIYLYYYSYRHRVLNNTIWVNGSSNSYSYAGLYAYYPWYSEIRNNIFINSGNDYFVSYYYPYYTTSDNNDYFFTASAYGGSPSGAYKYSYYPYNQNITDLPTFVSYNAGSSYLGVHDISSYNQVDPGLISMTNMHLMSGNVGLTGYLNNLKYDIDKDLRCVFQTYLGADEPYHIKITTDFYSQDTMCLLSPITFFNTFDSTQPHLTSWYRSLAPLGQPIFQTNNLNLTTKFLTSGLFTVKLVNQSCGSTDSVKRNIYIKASTSTPTSEFMLPTNVVETNQNMQIYDLTLNCPTRWKWKIVPDSVRDPVTNVLVPSHGWATGSTDTSQNPIIKFFYSGTFEVCLTTWNALGQGTTKCKSQYINVKFTDLMCHSNKESSIYYGVLYDDGGPSANYSNNDSCTYLISPCTQSIMIVISQFNLGTGAYLRLYDGINKKGVPLWNKALYPDGLTGNITDAGFPDTFYARKSGMVFVEFVSKTTTGTGFKLEWSGTGTGSFLPPVAGFTVYDTNCVVSPVFYQNTSIADTNFTQFSWDYDGDGKIDAYSVNGNYNFNFGGVSASYTTFLRARNCGGRDTFSKSITLINPRAFPYGSFHADVVHPIANQDGVTMYCDGNRLSCVNGFNWTFTPTSYYFANGTTANSAHPMVIFTDTVYYSASLVMWNTNAPMYKDSVYKAKYIKPIKNCTPVVINLLSDIGISRVKMGTIDQTSSIGVSKYTNYTNTQSSYIYVGQKYGIRLERLTNYNAMNRKVWIDYNQNGSFDDPGELVGYEDSANTLVWTDSFTVPSTNIVYGGTVMRVGASYASDSKSPTPCGPTLFGEYEDYRIYISPDNIPPVLTVLGAPTIYSEIGRTYTDPGATAWDNVDGNVTSRIVTTSTVNINKVGMYTVSYNVCDLTNNCAATQRRIVVITQDTTRPVITLYKGNPFYTNVNEPFVDSFSAYDLVSGNLTGKVVVTGTVNTKLLGTYVLLYSVKDDAGNIATATRSVIVVDRAAPEIIVLGANPMYLNIDHPFIDPGVIDTDNYWPASMLNFVKTGFVDNTTPGTYLITYSSTDYDGNGPTIKTRTVIVYDSVAPVITKAFGGDVVELQVNTLFVDPGVNVVDNSTHGITINKFGSFYDSFPSGIPTKLGNYIIFYQAIDLAKNKSSVYGRVIKVVDLIPPVITLKGNTLVYTPRWRTYTDSGYVATDNYYNSNLLQIDTFNNVDTLTLGLYQVSYTATDPSGNVSQMATRLVKVISPTSGINGNIADNIMIYPNPSKGIVSVEIESGEITGISVTNILGEEIKYIGRDEIKGNLYNIDLRKEQDGIYMVKVTTPEFTTIQKIVISR